jgi:hypothetical protein
VSSAPAPQFEPIQPIEDTQAIAACEAAVAVEPEQNTEADAGSGASPVAPPQAIEYIEVIHLTRTWVQYGILGFAVLCIVIGAVEALFGR